MSYNHSNLDATSGLLVPSDANILDVIFSQDNEFVNPTHIPLLPRSLEEQLKTATRQNELPPRDPASVKELKDLEREAIKQSKVSPQDALHLFSTILEKCGDYASGYNNRAQLHRMLDNDESAMEDLEKAIMYATARSEVSVLGQAYTQRAIIRKTRGDVAGSDEDFRLGAQAGNDVAKLAVKSNPYAKMCNSMVSELMKQYKPLESHISTSKE